MYCVDPVKTPEPRTSYFIIRVCNMIIIFSTLLIFQIEILAAFTICKGYRSHSLEFFQLSGLMDIFSRDSQMKNTYIRPRSDVDVPSWDDLNRCIRSNEPPNERSSFDMIALGRGPANSKAILRLFDAPDGYIPDVTLYRDHAAWCPYCEKVWLQLEEKRIPYKVEKVPLRCYGEKPSSFLRVSPSGMLPVINIRGKIISESNIIMQVVTFSVSVKVAFSYIIVFIHTLKLSGIRGYFPILQTSVAQERRSSRASR